MTIRALVLALAAALSTAAMAGVTGPDIDKVNGSIRIESGQAGGDLETVNGSVTLGDNAKADAIETVNGEVTLGDDASADSLETVNGGITIGQRTTVRHSVEAVNGSIEARRGADIGGDVSNVNGHIDIDAARVKGRVETVAGDIDIRADSHIQGGILVEKPSGFNWGKQKTPRIVIGPNAVVEGRLDFRREVELYVSDTAKVGAISGATAKPFSGASPK
ncbi:hypothetical protein [Tahibacter amnicola]|uniref:Polymer-forming protein n=1 Tax=Tahibacter amnicola TaxID=2976241 RepID=A0ABY6BFI0_9GAMM|nr:hypothetical protein [Tahibacter amnicola]UXI68624.1 hypothetical protein N4264_02945 [Tahibacter amnicola]